MKRLIVSGLLLVFIVGISIGALIYLDRTCTETITQAEKIKESIDQSDFKAANQEIDHLQTDWEKNEPYLCLFVRHTEVEEINRQISGLSDLLANQDYYETYVALNQIISIAEHLKITERPLPLYVF